MTVRLRLRPCFPYSFGFVEAVVAVVKEEVLAAMGFSYRNDDLWLLFRDNNGSHGLFDFCRGELNRYFSI